YFSLQNSFVVQPYRHEKTTLQSSRVTQIPGFLHRFGDRGGGSPIPGSLHRSLVGDIGVDACAAQGTAALRQDERDGALATVSAPRLRCDLRKCPGLEPPG